MLKFLKYKETSYIIIEIIIKSSKINIYIYKYYINRVIELCLLSYKLLYEDINIIYELNLKNFELIYITFFNLGSTCIYIINVNKRFKYK